jgi:dynactin-4
MECSYSCTCGKTAPLEELYYCIGCQGSKCVCCVHEEVVSTFCQQCLENVSSAEVIPNRGRCAKCFVCPCCGSVAKIVSREAAFLLRCVYCPWDSLAFAVAPSPANLIMLLREQERGGATSQLFKQRLQEYAKVTEEAATAKARQQSRHR